MRDPLTVQQKVNFMHDVEQAVLSRYERLLTSDALDPEEYDRGDHRILKIAATLAIADFGVLAADNKETLKNLSHY